MLSHMLVILRLLLAVDIMSRYGLDDRWLDGSNRVPEDDFHRRDDDWKPKRPDHKVQLKWTMLSRRRSLKVQI